MISGEDSVGEDAQPEKSMRRRKKVVNLSVGRICSSFSTSVRKITNGREEEERVISTKKFRNWGTDSLLSVDIESNRAEMKKGLEGTEKWLTKACLDIKAEDEEG